MIRTCQQACAVSLICGPKPGVLPAHVRDVVDPLPRRGDVPVDERQRPQHTRPVPVDRVLGRQVVVAYDLTAAGQTGAGRQVMELADQLGRHSQAVIRTSPHLLGWLPRDVPRQEAEDLPALLVHAPEPRRAVPASPFQPLQQPVHETRIPSGPPANRVTDAHHFGHEPAT